MIRTDECEDEAERDLHVAASEGALAEYTRTVEGADATLYRCVSKVVYEGLTRAVERGRGHESCAISVDRLRPDCLDRYQDDVVAVRDSLLGQGDRPIQNLHGWLVPRLRAATVDANRRRRGERGALQRPRLPLPRWLDAEIGHDPWLAALALEILTWVGVPAGLNSGLWPLGAWTDRRAQVTGTAAGSEARTASDVEAVLAAMRKDPVWYEKYVERPLGRKQAPLAPAAPAEAEPAHLALVPAHELADARLTELAAGALDAIESRTRRGEDLRAVVVDVLGVVFGSDLDVRDMERVPGADPDEAARVAGLLGDQATVDRVVAAVMAILQAG